jgi:hypothetical protein
MNFLWLGELLIVRVVWTHHAEDRQRQWEVKKGITCEEVERVVSQPEQIVPGEHGVQVAQSRAHGGLLRVPFLEIPEGRKILTVYWTSKVDKYWRQGGE